MTNFTAQQIEDWLILRLAAVRDVDPRTIDVRERFSHYGLDSLGAGRLISELSTLLGRRLSPTLVWEHPTLTALAHNLAGETEHAAVFEPQGASCDAEEPIAIVGIAVRFPGAPDVGSFWKLLCDGADAIGEVPQERGWDDMLSAQGVAPEERAKVRRGAFIGGIDQFDPLAFGISPREAASMDPQQRLMLELCWEALEDAGLRPGSLKGSQTAVFAGAIWSEYGTQFYRGDAAEIDQYTITGHHHSIIANRISYVLGLEGPSLTIDSACSSGLAVVQLACESLRRGESTLALAGAVNLDLLPQSALGVARFGALSPDGRCYTFDARANGYVRGEGGGVLVLKSLSQAIADGDPIRCVIRGGAVNNDGASSGLTAPSRKSQEALLRAAYRRAGVPMSAVQYVEAHGTGTPLGDAIEAQALGTVLGAGRPPDRPLLVGSAKTNLGHLEGAAGIVGLVKAALAIEHRQLPASLNFESANPHVPFSELGLAVPTSLGPWPVPELPLTAGISAFGLGGTNVHVVLSEWPAARAELLALAADSGEALRKSIDDLRVKLALDAGRSTLPMICAGAADACRLAAHRFAVVERSCAGLERALGAFLRGEADPLGGAGPPSPGPKLHVGPGEAATASPDPSQGVVFVFPGQGAQWYGMARALLQAEPVFRSVIESCDAHIRRFLGWSLIDELVASRRSSRLDRIEVSLPAIISIDVALAAWWRSLGIEPAAVVGHSTGEIAAAHVAGALDLQDTMQIICAYGTAIARLTMQGAMALVGLSWDEIPEALAGFQGRVFRAIQDSVSGTVVAGEPAAIDELLDVLQASGVFCRRVNMNVAPHSPLADPLRGDLFEALRGIRPRRGTVPLISEVTATELDGSTLGADHWVKNFGDQAFFSSAIEALLDRGHRIFLDVGPHPITKHSVEANLRARGACGVVLSSLRRDEDERGSLLDSLGALHALGLPARLSELYPPGDERADRRAWLLPLSAKSPAALVTVARQYSALLGSKVASVTLGDVAYSASTRRDHHPYRLALVGRTRGEMAEALSGLVRDSAASGVPHSRVPASGRSRVVFMFSGQGSQWLGMGRQLLAEEPAFRDAVHECDRALQAQAGWSLLAELTAESDCSQLARIDVVQPVLFCIQVALAALWRAWGVAPDVVVGHSMGEVAAAQVAGILSLEDAIRVICRRSRLLRGISGQGEMASVELSLEEAEAALRGYESKLSVAASNSPRATVLAGEPQALGELLSLLEQKGVFCRRVRVDVASHSPQVEPLRKELLGALSGLSPRDGAVPMLSTVTGQWVVGPELGASYWVDNLREPVKFCQAVQELQQGGLNFFVEVSPHPLLVPAVEELQQAGAAKGVTVGSLRRGQDERPAMLQGLGALWSQGLAVPWERLYPAGGRRVSLPSHPWQRERHWIEPPPEAANGRADRHPDGHPLLGQIQTLSTRTSTRLWETTLDLERLPWLADHRVAGVVVLPGAAYLEMGLAAAAAAFNDGPALVTDVVFSEALAFAGDTALTAREGRLGPKLGARQVQVVMTEEQPGRLRFQIASRAPGAGPPSWSMHVRGSLRTAEHSAIPARLALGAVRARMVAGGPAPTMYAELADMGLQYGPAFQGLVELWRGEGEALGKVSLPAVAGAPAAYRLHPALLDACFQVMGAILTDQGDTHPFVPAQVGSLRLFQRPAGELWCHALIVDPEHQTPHRRSADLKVVDSTGAAVAEVNGLVVQRLTSGARQREDDWFLELVWEPAAVPRPRVTGGRWLLLGCGGGIGLSLRQALESAGHAVVHVAGSSTSAASLRTILADAFRGQAPTAVVHLGSLDSGVGLDSDAVEAALMGGPDSVLATVQALASQGFRDAPRLWLLTRGAQAVGPQAVSVVQAPVLGLGRVIALEHAELRCVRVDLDPSCPEGELDALIAELTGDDAEEEVALRTDGRRVARLVHWTPGASRAENVEPALEQAFRLEIDEPGVLDRLVLRATARRAPGPGEVMIAVDAAGLNFIDVMKTMGIYPGLAEEPVALGGECAGHVVSIGEGVSSFRVGQAVVAIAPFSFGTHVTVDVRNVAPCPEALTLAQAAALPIVFMTAWYGLVHLGRLRGGERVLIQSATGGTGLAAVQIARYLGAEVLATAGTPEKRAWLRAQGIAHVMDSRSLDFAEEVLAATAGEGVDVVLNSLSGAAIEAGLATLAPDGRFIEIGKTDIHADRPLGLAHFKKSLSYSAVDLAGLAERRPSRFAALFAEVMDLFARDVLRPIPVETFPISQASAAVRKMAQAQHIGKLVLTLKESELRIRVPAKPGVPVRKDGSYLITGGLGGLGLSVAGWLAAAGAGQLVLVGRSGAVSVEQQAAVAALAARGVRVTVATADVAERAELERILNAISASELPLRGVVHAAGLLDDGLLIQQTPARLRRVMAPKVQGALHLDALTREAPLDFFVLYASVAGLLGSPGQGNYAAANTFLDALSQHRRAAGRPALSVDWGTFSGVGMAAAQDNRGARLACRGIRSLTPDEGVWALGRLLDSDRAQSGVAALQMRQWVEFYPVAAASRMLSRLLTTQRRESAGDQAVLERLAATEPRARATLMQELLRAQVARVLRLREETIDIDVPLTNIGMDSLMGLELRNRIESSFGITVAATLLWTYPTIRTLGAHLLGRTSAAPGEEPLQGAAPAPTHTDSSIAISGMSREELTHLIAAEFEALK